MIRKSKIKNQKSKSHIKIQNPLKNFKFWFCFLIFVFCIFPTLGGIPLWRENFNCYAQAISSSELIENAQNYDGQKVTYEGEVIGEIMQRRDGVWANINDGENSIGVWMSSELAKIITYKGSYKTRGDILEVKGIFNRACPQHGGDLDIHAISLRKIKPGWQRQEEVIPAKRSLVIILLVVLCLVLILRILIIK